MMLLILERSISAFDVSTDEPRISYTDSSRAVHSWYAVALSEYVPSVDWLLYCTDHETGNTYVFKENVLTRDRAYSLSNAFPTVANDFADAVTFTDQKCSVIFINVHTSQTFCKWDIRTEPRFWQHGKCIASPSSVFGQFLVHTTYTRERLTVQNIRTGDVVWSKNVVTFVFKAHGLGGIRVAGSISNAYAIAAARYGLSELPNSAIAEVNPTIWST